MVWNSDLLSGAVLALFLFASACGGDDDDSTEASGPASAEIFSPVEGAEVSNPVTVGCKVQGITLEPQGIGKVTEGRGHLHLIVDNGCVEAGQPIPPDGTPGYNHVGYGKFQTAASIDLTPGQHTLCLQVGNGAHIALDLTDEVTVTALDPANQVG
jgi:hypothetical protein